MFGNRTFKRLGYKKVKIKGETFIIKKLTPADFLDTDGIPFTIFHIEEPTSIWGQVYGKIKSEDEKKREETENMKAIMGVLKAGVIKFPNELTAENYKSIELLQTGIILYEAIITHSMSFFLRPYTVSRKQLLYWDLMAKRYGKLPIECLLPKWTYTPVDAFIFNSYVLGVAMQEEIRQAKRKKK